LSINHIIFVNYVATERIILAAVLRFLLIVELFHRCILGLACYSYYFFFLSAYETIKELKTWLAVVRFIFSEKV
tara:strand:+ start:428 stop:649 length:222 start_codon:yes stop_codon:yes gene_type:complete